MIQNIEYTGPRIETRALKIGEDWPGLFIRGDNAYYLTTWIDACKDNPVIETDLNMKILFSILRGISDDIHSDVVVGPNSNKG